jgi:hypothetical protein
LNGHVLGQFDHFQRTDNRLEYISTSGEPCGNTTYSLNISLECDQTLAQSTFTIPSFIYTDSTKCHVWSVLRSRDACKISWLNKRGKAVHEIKCIEEATYEEAMATFYSSSVRNFLQSP